MRGVTLIGSARRGGNSAALARAARSGAPDLDWTCLHLEDYPCRRSATLRTMVRSPTATPRVRPRAYSKRRYVRRCCCWPRLGNKDTRLSRLNSRAPNLWVFEVAEHVAVSRALARTFAPHQRRTRPGLMILLRLSTFLLLSLFTATLFAQDATPLSAQTVGRRPPGQLEVMTRVGVVASDGARVAAGLGLRLAVAPRFVIEASAGSDPWRAAVQPGIPVGEGVLRSAKLYGGASRQLSLAVYAEPDRSGWTGAIGLGSQRYTVEAESDFYREPRTSSASEPGSGGNVGVALISTFYQLLTAGARDAGDIYTHEERTTGRVTTLHGRIGYALALDSGARLELTARGTWRLLGGETYGFVGARGESSLVDGGVSRARETIRRGLAEDFPGVSIGAELRYVLPLAR